MRVLPSSSAAAHMQPGMEHRNALRTSTMLSRSWEELDNINLCVRAHLELVQVGLNGAAPLALLALGLQLPVLHRVQHLPQNTSAPTSGNIPPPLIYVAPQPTKQVLSPSRPTRTRLLLWLQQGNIMRVYMPPLHQAPCRKSSPGPAGT